MPKVAAPPYSYRLDPAVADFPDDRPIIVFDGDCALCSAWVQFALKHDRTATYRFLAAQSPLGEALYRHYGLSPTNYETNILIKNGVAQFKAEGTVEMISGLGFPWSVVKVFRLLPRRWQDACYELVARNRTRWFGRRQTCLLAIPAYTDRFIA